MTGAKVFTDPSGYGALRKETDPLGRDVTDPLLELVSDQPYNKFLNEPIPVEYAPHWTGELEKGMAQYERYVAERTAIYIYNWIKRDFIRALID